MRISQRSYRRNELMRRAVSLALCLVMILSMAGCSSGEKSKEPDTGEAAKVTEAAENASDTGSDVGLDYSQVPEGFEPLDETPKDTSLMGFNMIEDGTFDEGITKWHTYLEGGNGKLVYDGEMLGCEISNVGLVEHGVQIYYDGFRLDNSCKYEISVDACSTIPRTIQYRIQINGKDYHAYNMEYVELAEEMQHYTIDFTMEEDTDTMPRLCFNMGDAQGSAAKVAGEKHTVFIDNLELYCTDESARDTSGGEVQLPNIMVNQIGYRPDSYKVAVFSKVIDETFKVVNINTGETAFEGKTSPVYGNYNTMRYEAKADFSELTAPGSYKIVGKTAGESYTFRIAEDVYDKAFDASLKMFYYARCGVELTGEFAGRFAHPECHMTDAKIFGYGDNYKSVTGGWHDAGDYGRYTVAGAKAVADLLLAYENYTDVMSSDERGIPESGNGVPDVLDEVRYELEWMLMMQEPDGSVYHKITCAEFPGTVMPQDEVRLQVLCKQSTTATADFAAVMAMAGKIYADVDPEFAGRCLEAAVLSYNYMENFSGFRGFKNPSSITTGEYGDGVDRDEILFMDAELFRVTGDKKYEDAFAQMLGQDVVMELGWQEVGLYGIYEYLRSEGADASVREQALAVLEEKASEIAANSALDTYGCSIAKRYRWGSNMMVANNAMTLIMAQELTGTDYSREISAHFDYLLGDNGNCYCFLTGFGTLSPKGTHHRPSQVLETTLPGMLVGGPNSDLEDPYAELVLPGKAPALCYVDNSASYSCNEITIYWNSPFVYLMAYQNR